ncbi:MAG: hypothetical protein ACYTEX_28520 [Planctomycetota bacterium]|jgi:hypothetical protein
MIRLDFLARRIPFKLHAHLSTERCHSSRYHNAQLDVGYESHVQGKTVGGMFDPSGKVEQLFYRESNGGDAFPTLVGLLRACPKIAAKARQLYAHKTAQPHPSGLTRLEPSLRRWRVVARYCGEPLAQAFGPGRWGLMLDPLPARSPGFRCEDSAAEV